MLLPWKATSIAQSRAVPTRRLRILHVVTRYLHGGSEQRIRDAIAATPLAEHVLLVGAEADLARPPGPNCIVRRVPILHAEMSPLKDIWSLLEVIRFMRLEGPFDVVTTHQSKAGVIGRIAAALTLPEAKIIHSYSMANFGEGYRSIESALFKNIERVLSRSTDQYSVVGEDLLGRLVAAGLPREKMTTIRSGVELRPFRAINTQRRQRGPVDHDVKLLFVGALTKRKGADRLLHLANDAANNLGRRILLTVAGTGPLGPPTYPSTISAEKYEVRYLGYSPAVADLMLPADLLILPSTAEGLPQVLVQSFAAGLPFVSYDIDGGHELISQGACGRVVPLGDEEAFVSAIGEVLESDVANENTCSTSNYLAQWDRLHIFDAYSQMYSVGSVEATIVKECHAPDLFA